MIKRDDKKLDNPVWFSAAEGHPDFSIDYNGLRCYHPHYCPFGGFINTLGISKHLEAYSKLAGHFFIVGEKPVLSGPLNLKKELVCLQMVISNSIGTAMNEPITALTTTHTDALFQLVNLVQPGYFSKKTALLGDYFGIFKDNQLIAAAGERMQMNDFIEVSAIVTHPDHTGKGYAQQLIAHTVNNIFNKNKLPFLHVAENNTGAIRLYEKIGFTTRRKMSFWPVTT